LSLLVVSGVKGGASQGAIRPSEVLANVGVAGALTICWGAMFFLGAGEGCFVYGFSFLVAFGLLI
jgi:hypothetical protein